MTPTVGIISNNQSTITMQLGDSDAVHNPNRVFSQHQSALTLLGDRLQDPAIDEYQWLDLACGKGQIITQLEKNLSPDLRSKISYHGYDVNVNHTRLAERAAEQLGFSSFTFIHGDIGQFNKLFDADVRFDFVTCTNTAHELQPGVFASTLVDSILRLSENGVLYVYDMEFLTNPELGALPWQAHEIAQLLDEAFSSFGSELRANPQEWDHTTCSSWSVTVRRDHLGVSSEDIEANRADSEARIESTIDKILNDRLSENDKALRSFAKYKPETAEDEQTKLLALYDFWAVSNAIKMRKK